MRPGLSRKASTVELTRDTVGGDPTTSPPIDSVAMSADGRYLAITTVRTKFALPALQLLGEPRPVPGRARAVRRRPAGPHARTGHPLLRRRRHRRRRAERRDASPPTGARVAFTSFAGEPLLRRREPEHRRLRRRRASPIRAGGPSHGGPRRPAASTIEIDRGGPQIGVRARSKARGRDRPHGLGSRRRRCQGGGEGARRQSRASSAPWLPRPARGRGRAQQRAAGPAPGASATAASCVSAGRSPAASSSAYVAVARRSPRNRVAARRLSSDGTGTSVAKDARK